jgi:hypothetical protein
MTPTDFSNSVYAALGVFALAWLWHCGWRQLSIDLYRQELFEIRDRLFDLAAQQTKTFGFDHPAYGPLRMQFNGAIRFAHRLNAIQLVLFKVLRLILGPRVSPIDIEGPLDEKLATVDCATQAEIVRLRELWGLATMRFLLRTSPLIYLVIVAIMSRLLLISLRQYLKKKVQLPRYSFKLVSRRLTSTVWDDVAFANYCEDEENAPHNRARAATH